MYSITSNFSSPLNPFCSAFQLSKCSLNIRNCYFVKPLRPSAQSLKIAKWSKSPQYFEAFLYFSSLRPRPKRPSLSLRHRYYACWCWPLNHRGARLSWSKIQLQDKADDITQTETVADRLHIPSPSTKSNNSKLSHANTTNTSLLSPSTS